jgi:hypothetical protein
MSFRRFCDFCDKPAVDRPTKDVTIRNEMAGESHFRAGISFATRTPGLIEPDFCADCMTKLLMKLSDSIVPPAP